MPRIDPNDAFVCMPLYSFPHLILEGAPFSHAFKPLNKYKPTQELHLHLYVLSIVLFFSSESPQIFGPVTGCFPWLRLQLQASHFIVFPLPFVHFPFCPSCCLLLAIIPFFFYPLFFHHDPKSLNMDYIPCITTLTLAEEFLETKKKTQLFMSPFVILLFCTCFWLKCCYELTHYC